MVVLTTDVAEYSSEVPFLKHTHTSDNEAIYLQFLYFTHIKIISKTIQHVHV